MNTKLAAGILTGLLYAQGLLGFAGLATVLLKDRIAEVDVAQQTGPAQLPGQPAAGGGGRA